MRKYKTILSVYQNQDIEREFFSNTTIFINAVDPQPNSESIINNIYYLIDKLKIKGGKNEIDITRYNINTLQAPFPFFNSKRCIVLNKIYD